MVSAASRPSGLRRLKQQLTSLSLLAVVLLCGSAAALAQSSDSMAVRPAATFLRETPDLRGTVVLRLERGDRVEVLDRSEGDWWRVRAGTPPREGYVHRLVLVEAADAAPAAPARSRLPRLDPPSPDADEPEPAAAPRSRGPGIALFGGAGLFIPTARDTFDAVDITGNPLAIVGGVEVTRVYKGLFVGASVERVAETGERAFLTDDGERFGLGIPLDVTLLPIEGTVGWRFESSAPTPARLVPFVGGGVGVQRYRETDPFATADEEVDEQFVAYHVLAGADVGLARWVGLRVSYRFRFVPDSLGDGGVSAITGDSSLGGSTLAVGVVIGR